MGLSFKVYDSLGPTLTPHIGQGVLIDSGRLLNVQELLVPVIGTRIREDSPS